MSEPKTIKPIDEIRVTVTRMEPEFAKALPPHISTEKFVRVVMTAVQNNPDILNADRTSLYNACMRAAQDGLLPDGREGAIVVYRTKSGPIAQWMPMTAGLKKKMRNSGEIGDLTLQVVKERDEFALEFGDNPKLFHRPSLSSRGKTIGAYSVVTLKDGEKSREWMNVEEIEDVRARSRAKDSGPWVSDYDEMCKKTVFRRHSKNLPMSTDQEKFVTQDDDVIDVKAEDVAAPHLAKPKQSRLEALVADTKPNASEEESAKAADSLSAVK